MGQWSDLPRELVDLIDELLVQYVDKVRVRVICMSWNSHLPKMPVHQVGRQIPWLLQSLENNSDSSHGLFDLSEKKFYKLDLPEAQGKLFKGSSHGWLVSVEDIPGAHGGGIPIRSISSSPADMYLINPLTRERIQLPPRYTFPDVEDYHANRVGREYALLDLVTVVDKYASREGDYFHYASLNKVNSTFMDKVVLSSTPSDKDCFVVAIYGEANKLAWCKCTDMEWKPLPSGRLASFDDVIFYNGKLHALNCKGELLVFESICSNPKVKKIAKLPSSIINTSDITYLVECSDGGLVMVTRVVDFSGEEEDSLTLPTQKFQVYKLDSNNSIWVPVKNIGDDIVFLGLNSSFALSSHDFPGYEGNCIYFTDSPVVFQSRARIHGHSDIGVFNLEDESFESFPGFRCNPKFLWPPAVWVTPPGYY